MLTCEPSLYSLPSLLVHAIALPTQHLVLVHRQWRWWQHAQVSLLVLRRPQCHMLVVVVVVPQVLLLALLLLTLLLLTVVLLLWQRRRQRWRRRRRERSQVVHRT